MTISRDSGVNFPVTASQHPSMSTPKTPPPSAHPTPENCDTTAMHSAYVLHVLGSSLAALRPLGMYGTLVGLSLSGTFVSFQHTQIFRCFNSSIERLLIAFHSL